MRGAAVKDDIESSLQSTTIVKGDAITRGSQSLAVIQPNGSSRRSVAQVATHATGNVMAGKRDVEGSCLQLKRCGEETGASPDATDVRAVG